MLEMKMTLARSMSIAFMVIHIRVHAHFLVYSFVPRTLCHRYRHRHHHHFAKRTNVKHKSGGNATGGKGGKKQKMERQDLNALVKSIGLSPVENHISKEHKHELHSKQQKQKQKQKQKQRQDQEEPSQTSKVPLKTQLQYARNGHAVLRSKIPPSTIDILRKDLLPYASSKELEAWQQKVQAASDNTISNKEIAQKYHTSDQCRSFLKKQGGDDDDTIPFLQHFNTWRDIPSVREFVTSTHLTTMARTLLDVSGIRLYQDSLFHKRIDDGWTPWHSDARMAPFDTSHMITFWIPLQNILSEEDGGSGLLFVDKSHCDFALPFWNRVPKGDVGDGEDYDAATGKVKYEESQEYERLDERYRWNDSDDGVRHYMPMTIGDCTVHAGWTLHSANSGTRINGVPQKFSQDRYALAVTFVDAKAEIREDAVMSGSLGHGEDRKSYEAWISEVKPRTFFEHPLVPIL